MPALEALLALAAVRSVGAIVSNLTAPAPVVRFPQGPPRPYGPFVGRDKDGRPFDEHLRAGLPGPAGDALALHFSPEASQRLAERGVRLDARQFERLLGAVEEAAQRGGETALVLMDGLAYIVDVRERRVIEVTDKYGLSNLAYGRIDSVIEANS